MSEKSGNLSRSVRQIALDALGKIRAPSIRTEEWGGLYYALQEIAARSEIRPWLAFDVGCIECGESSAVIGTFSTKEEAESACEIAARKQEKEWHGQHSMEVFDLRVKEDQ